MKQGTKGNDTPVNPEDIMDENVNNPSDSNDIVDEPQDLAGESSAPEETEKSDFDKLKDELAEFKDKYLRLYSEFDNYRKRTAKEKLDLIQNANEQLLVALLPIIDDFERAMSNIPATSVMWLPGSTTTFMTFTSLPRRQEPGATRAVRH